MLLWIKTHKDNRKFRPLAILTRSTNLAICQWEKRSPNVSKKVEHRQFHLQVIYFIFLHKSLILNFLIYILMIFLSSKYKNSYSLFNLWANQRNLFLIYLFYFATQTYCLRIKEFNSCRISLYIVHEYKVAHDSGKKFAKIFFFFFKSKLKKKR